MRVELVIALTIGCLYGGAFYLMLRRSIVKLLLGLGVLGHAANLLIFSTSGLRRIAPIVEGTGLAPHGAVADPVPQALILTAIVISFGVLAFSVVLIKLTAAAAKTDDVDSLRTSEE
ncbi:MAG: NADH-quinone oxidoreductase subunit K [Candidatus Binatia bacterium]|nr:NADH-quinone oxidoreductase subunit K [Candidatus Binatia bacterium]